MAHPVLDYARKNKSAMELLKNSDCEYLACRCGLIRGHIPLLILGALAIEKYLKAYLLFKDPTNYTLPHLKKKFGHKIAKLLEEAGKHEPGFSRFLKNAKKWEANFEARYPDNSSKATSMSSEELKDIDEFVFFLYEHLSIPDDVKARTMLFTTLIPGPTDFVYPTYKEDLLNSNIPFQSYLKTIK